MKQSSVMDEVHWHDAVLLAMDVHLTTGVQGYDMELSLEVYPSPDASARVPVKIYCHGVVRTAMTVDFLELIDNASAGNVSNVQVNQKDRTTGHAILRAYLSEGLLEVAAARFEYGLISKVSGSS